MDSMLSKALRGFLAGPLNQLIVNLSGRNAVQWEREFGKFLRMEPCWLPWEKIVEASDGIRLMVCSEWELRAFSFPEHSLHTADSFFCKAYLAPTLERATDYAGKPYLLVGFKLATKPVAWEQLLDRLGGGGRTPVFTDFEELRAIIASLIIKQPGGRPGVLNAKLINRFLVNTGPTMSSVVVMWRHGYGWGIGFEDFHSYTLDDNFIVRV